MFRFFTSAQRWIREGAASSQAAVGDVNTLTATDSDAADVSVGSFFRLLDQYGRYKEDQLFTITAKASAFGFTNIDFTPDALEPIVMGDQLHSLREADPGDTPVAYWPMEDEREATTIASGLVGGAPLTPSRATPEFASIDEFLGSAPILKLNDAELNAQIPDYDDTNEAFTLHFLLRMPDADEAATGQALIQFYTTGTAEIWALVYATGGGNGDLQIRAFDRDGVQLFSTPYDLHARGTPLMVSLTLEQTGPSTVAYELGTVIIPAGTVSGPATATATGVADLGKITRVQVNPGAGYVEAGFGHLGVIPAAYSYFNLSDYPGGRATENAARRLIRLGFEEGVPITYCQGPAFAAAPTLGAQKRDTLLSNWQDAADVDMGRLYESRGAYSFEYRTRTSLENQDPAIEVDYTSGAVLADFVPTRDDQASRNDITVKRDGGSQARAVLETGPKSIETIGRYTDAPTIIAASDIDLPDQAAWRLHLGTVADDRYPSIKLTSVNGGLSLERLLSAGIGSRVVVTNAGARRRYEPISQLVSGYTLTLDRYAPTLEINGTPESPYRVAVLGDDTCRLDSDSTVTTEDLDTTETGILIASTDGVTDWVNSTDDASEFPFDIIIGGERMTVTACGSPSGASLAQNMTVTRSVNGVVKTHLSGAEVHLADPVYLPL
jgi:hypothetical protein